MKKYYVNIRTGEITRTAVAAMEWHRNGDALHVMHPDLNHTLIKGVKKPVIDENRQHCKRIALDLEQWATGKMFRCPYCDEWHSFPNDVGDKFCCPDCHTVNDVHDWDVSHLWDYLNDVLDINYLVEHDRKTVRSVKILVAFGGPNIYIDTESKAVELYWWTDRASYPIKSDVVDALDEWAQEMFELG